MNIFKDLMLLLLENNRMKKCIFNSAAGFYN